MALVACLTRQENALPAGKCLAETAALIAYEREWHQTLLKHNIILSGSHTDGCTVYQGVGVALTVECPPKSQAQLPCAEQETHIQKFVTYFSRLSWSRVQLGTSAGRCSPWFLHSTLSSIQLKQAIEFVARSLSLSTHILVIKSVSHSYQANAGSSSHMWYTSAIHTQLLNQALCTVAMPPGPGH